MPDSRTFTPHGADPITVDWRRGRKCILEVRNAIPRALPSGEPFQ